MWCAAISLLFSLGFRLRCSRRAAARPAARYSQGTARGQKLIAEASLCCFSFFTRAMRKGGEPRPSPAPKQEGIHPTGRRSPFGGGAGRRLPCPNGALLEKNGQVTRREEAAGASIWGLGSGNRPSGQWAGNNRCQASTIFRPVSGPNSYGKPSVGRAQGREGSMAAVERGLS